MRESGRARERESGRVGHWESWLSRSPRSSALPLSRSLPGPLSRSPALPLSRSPALPDHPPPALLLSHSPALRPNPPPALPLSRPNPPGDSGSILTQHKKNEALRVVQSNHLQRSSRRTASFNRQQSSAVWGRASELQRPGAVHGDSKGFKGIQKDSKANRKNKHKNVNPTSQGATFSEGESG